MTFLIIGGIICALGIGFLIGYLVGYGKCSKCSLNNVHGNFIKRR